LVRFILPLKVGLTAAGFLSSLSSLGSLYALEAPELENDGGPDGLVSFATVFLPESSLSRSSSAAKSSFPNLVPPTGGFLPKVGLEKLVLSPNAFFSPADCVFELVILCSSALSSSNYAISQP
jgi:hypothetical protein